MWEWEDQDDPGGDGGGLSAAEIADFQKAELERRKEQERIERRINVAIDDRIAAYKNTIRMNKLELDSIYKSVQAQEQYAKKLKEANEALAAAREMEDGDARTAAINAATEAQKKSKAEAEKYGKA